MFGAVKALRKRMSKGSLKFSFTITNFHIFILFPQKYINIHIAK